MVEKVYLRCYWWWMEYLLSLMDIVLRRLRKIITVAIQRFPEYRTLIRLKLSPWQFLLQGWRDLPQEKSSLPDTVVPCNIMLGDVSWEMSSMAVIFMYGVPLLLFCLRCWWIHAPINVITWKFHVSLFHGQGQLTEDGTKMWQLCQISRFYNYAFVRKS